MSVHLELKRAEAAIDSALDVPGERGVDLLCEAEEARIEALLSGEIVTDGDRCSLLSRLEFFDFTARLDGSVGVLSGAVQTAVEILLDEAFEDPAACEALIRLAPGTVGAAACARALAWRSSARASGLRI